MYRVLKAVKLQCSDIPEEGLRFDIRGEDGRWEGLKGFSVEAQPRGHLFVQRRGRDVFVRGEVRTTLRFECSRCLEGFPYQVQTTLSQLLRPRGEDRAEAKEIELAPDDLECGTYDGEDTPAGQCRRGAPAALPSHAASLRRGLQGALSRLWGESEPRGVRLSGGFAKITI